MASMNSFIDTTMTIEIGRQRRTSFESIARRDRLTSPARRWWRPDRRRRGDTGPPGNVVGFPVTVVVPAARPCEAATARVA